MSDSDQILCLGDIILDTYCEGFVDRISPEAPIPILKVENDKKKDLGGSGNVARNITAAGNKSHLISIIGDDNNAKIFISIHANAIDNSPNTKGFETYLLKIEKSSAAVDEVVKRENSVIDQFQANENTNTISRMNAILIQSANFEQSEDLAQLIQEEVSKTTNKNSTRKDKPYITNCSCLNWIHTRNSSNSKWSNYYFNLI